MKIEFLRYSKRLLLAIITTTVLFTSCKKDKNEPDTLEPVIESTAGVYVLCEGTYGNGNGDISFYNFKTNTAEKSYYKKVNGSNLGETPNDLQRYGSKMYCVVSGTSSQPQSFVDVMDVNTCKSIKRIPFNSTTGGYEPRSIAFYKNKAYVSRYDGKVSRIDTATLNVDAELNLEVNYLEGVATANGKLYVANSDYLYTGNVNKISVIDLATFKKTKDITVSLNPGKVVAAPNGDIYVICYGNYYTKVAGALDRISSITDTKVQTTPGYGYGSALSFTSDKGIISTETSVIRQLDVATGTAGANFITDGTSFTYLYGVTIDPFSNMVVAGDGVSYTSGKAFIFGSNGKKLHDFETGVYPKASVFVYSYKKQ
ncbi:DUF5074 domain-containing protein [Mucilaginibacter sp. PAMB04274]|uniref:DUF5074 domain-containing protein n=1 Tax=Mucilaginibacter sp. PAMB04274 TaxID=3138568 RepID=UPI0031F71545